MAQRIPGQAAPPNDNNPVEVRLNQLDATLVGELGGIPTSPIWQSGGPQVTAIWIYFPNGIVVWSAGTCARALYGPIFEYWAGTGQMGSYLGFPLTDISPDGSEAWFAVFENGVLWTDGSGHVEELSPLSNDLVRRLRNVDLSADGVTALAQARIGDDGSPPTIERWRQGAWRAAHVARSSAPSPAVWPSVHRIDGRLR